MTVTLITGASPSLVRPLVESLRHDMVARDGLVLQKKAGVEALPLREALRQAMEGQDKLEEKAKEPAATDHRPGDSRVRSVQRIPLPHGRDSFWVAQEFMQWLPHFMRPFLRVDVDEPAVVRPADARLPLEFELTDNQTL